MSQGRLMAQPRWRCRRRQQRVRVESEHWRDANSSVYFRMCICEGRRDLLYSKCWGPRSLQSGAVAQSDRGNFSYHYRVFIIRIWRSRHSNISRRVFHYTAVCDILAPSQETCLSRIWRRMIGTAPPSASAKCLTGRWRQRAMSHLAQDDVAVCYLGIEVDDALEISEPIDPLGHRLANLVRPGGQRLPL